MSIAATIGHSVTDLVGHRGHAHRVARPVPPAAPAPSPAHRPVDIDAGVAARRRDAEQWRASYLVAASLNR
ncbi:hypothetical protein GON03_13185 [Nocardioides sp. MAH-18]|uniref:Uncharacterized protein n=1 Tax=Nocardioides agri TaxID=2682843 RepID=A0A6L6XT09_9ACTN|nr:MULTISPECIES: hypothetical protein [unclassified Nocardioides]MBA2955287.1 hypothetical protein [Nocardioides sp. CGMCC 1.13656]MVQ50138.1 hypothetical protein [Nocardioides sp. MAH-18]